MKLIAGILTSLLATHAAAETVPQIHDFVEKEIGQIADVWQGPGPLLQANSKQDFELSKFKLRLRAEVGFDVEFGKIALVPGLELSWEVRKEEALRDSIVHFELDQVNTALESSTFSSRDHEGQVLVIEAFQLRCQPCIDNAPNVAEMAGFYSYDPRVNFIDLGTDRDVRSLKRWIEMNDVDYAVLHDPNRRLLDQLGVRATPTTYIISPDMRVAYKHVGVWTEQTRDEITRVVDELLAELDR